MRNSETLTESNSDMNISALLILDEKTFMPKWTYFLEANELSMAILSAELGPEKEKFIVVGTAEVLPDEIEPKKGRILIFKWTTAGKVSLSIIVPYIGVLDVFRRLNVLTHASDPKRN